MVWTDTTRIRYDRIGGRYSSDCNDEEWALIESFMPCRRTNGASTNNQPARCLGCYPIHGFYRLPVVDDPQ